MSASPIRWITRSDLRRSGEESVLADWTERLMASLSEKSTVDDYLKSLLLELSAEFSALTTGWWERRPAWTLLSRTGRQPSTELDLSLREDVLDREDAVVFSQEDVTWLMFPVTGAGLIALGGKTFDEERSTTAGGWGRCSPRH